MLQNSKIMLEKARDDGYAVPAFNVENAEMVFAVVAAARQQKAPVILQTTPSTLRYLPPDCFVGMVRAAAKDAQIPIALHLDHGNSLDLVRQCLEAGYTSVMFDGSALPVEENIRQTALAADLAHCFQAGCEGELGAIGGKEDSLEGTQSAYTDPQEAAQFAKESGVDSLAVAIGTAHGVYQTLPVLDLGRIAWIQSKMDLPLVLHGASGLADKVVRDAVAKGMAKVNFATELRIAFSSGVKSYLAENPDVFDPKKYLACGRNRVQLLAEEKIRVLGAAGKG